MSDSISNPVPPAASPQPAVPPPQQPIGVPQPKSSNTALKVILIVIGIFVALGLIVAGIFAYGVYRVAHSIHKDSSGNISISTPKGTITANSSEPFTASDLGIAIYPGAQQGKGSVRINMGSKSMVSAIFLTSDSEDKVIAFYKDQAGPDAQSVVSGNTAEFVISASSGDSITVTIAPSNTSSGQTQITIVRVPKG